jgi:hypothetical protein
MSQLTVILPIELFNGFIYITYVVWITNLYDDVGRYFMFALMFLSCLVLMILYGLFVGSFSATPEKAAVVAPLFFMFALVGMFIIHYTFFYCKLANQVFHPLFLHIKKFLFLKNLIVICNIKYNTILYLLFLIIILIVI